jgi:hypothetical protein
MSVLDEIIQHLRNFRDEATVMPINIIDYKPNATCDDYNKAWFKLNKQQKINRIMLYVQGMHTGTLQLRQLLMDALSSDILDDEAVDYADKQISKIRGLKYENGVFYLDSVSPNSKTTSHVGKISCVPIDKSTLIGKKTILVKRKTLDQKEN